MERLAAGASAAAGSISAGPGKVRVSLEFSGDAQAGSTTLDVLARTLVASLARSRELSRRMMSASQLSGIMHAALIYAGKHDGQWPGSLSDLLQAELITLDMVGNVYEGTGPRTVANVERESYYLFRRDVPEHIGQPASFVVAGERYIRSAEGANFAFADGHVEFVTEPDASRLLAILRAHSY
jgi:prepilin-type processing-associated H-X9-DG protein